MSLQFTLTTNIGKAIKKINEDISELCETKKISPISYAPILKDDALNSYLVRETEKDNVLFFVTDISQSTTLLKNSNTGLNFKVNQEGAFTLRVVKLSDLSVNNFNEASGHCVDESLLVTHIEKLYPYIDLFLEKFKSYCQEIELGRLFAEPILRYSDNNYSGWRIRINYTQR